MGAIFHTRSDLYKIGALGSVIASILFLIGALSPYWIESSIRSLHIGLGLFYGCVSTSGTNVCVGVKSSATRIIAALLIVAAAIFTGIAVVINFVQNRKDENLPKVHSRKIEIFLITAGVLGIIGVGVFGGTTNVSSQSVSYGWSFILTILGAISLLITGVMVYIANKPLPPPQPQLYPMENLAAAQGGPQVVVQTSNMQQGYGYPAHQPSLPYPGHPSHLQSPPGYPHGYSPQPLSKPSHDHIQSSSQ